MAGEPERTALLQAEKGAEGLGCGARKLKRRAQAAGALVGLDFSDCCQARSPSSSCSCSPSHCVLFCKPEAFLREDTGHSAVGSSVLGLLTQSGPCSIVLMERP